ncbi:MAG: hypothetical protein IJ717_04130 [Treponema sp.]|nr:hypothetical protein [Treponema sp.]
MPLPLIIGIGAAIAGAAGIGAGIHGGVKMKEAKDTSEAAQRRNERNTKKLKECNNETLETMDKLGKHELEIIASFKKFSNIFEKIKNRPTFEEIKKDDIDISPFTPRNIEDAAVGASVLLGGLGGAALGTAGGFAAAGGTTAAVMAFGTASTGTAIASLSGVAATNATLAALGGGSLAVGGGGMALGSAILGGATLGVGLLIGGIIFNIAGSSVSDKAEAAYDKMLENEQKINSICEYLERLKVIAENFENALSKVNSVYTMYISILEEIVSYECDYNNFKDVQKQALENTVLLVGLLYNMCKVQIVKESTNESEMNEINEKDINKELENANRVLTKTAAVH